MKLSFFRTVLYVTFFVLIMIMLALFFEPTNINAVLPEIRSPYELILTDFSDYNTGKTSRRATLRAAYGVWNRFPDDDSQYCKLSYVKNRDGKQGYSIKLDYDVDSENPAYNGFWIRLNADFTAYDALVLEIKGDIKVGYTKRVKIEIKDKYTKSVYILDSITNRWKKIIIPFSNFWKIKDWSAITEIVLVFDDITSRPKKGTIYINSISVIKK